MGSTTTVRCDAGTNREVYAHGAAAYDDVWSPVILPPAARVVDRLDLGGASCVVDIGAGTGALTPTLRAAAPAAHIVSVEPAHEMLRYARRQHPIVPLQADALALPLRTGTADAVLLAYVLFMLVDPIAGLREATRVLRPGGRVGTVTWAAEEPTPAAIVWDETLDELDVPSLPAHSNHGGLDDEDAMARALGEAGLVPRQIWRETVKHTFDPAAFFRLRTQHGTSRLRLATLDVDRRQRVLDVIRARFASLPRSAYRFRGTLVCSVSHTVPSSGDPA
jgi:SAM-dependent methyltransferase